MPKEVLTILDTPAEKRTKPQVEAAGAAFPFDRAGVEAGARRDRRAGEVQAEDPEPCR